MFKVTKEELDAIHPDYKGEWQNYYNDHPEWIGRKVVMSICLTHDPNELGSLFIEGVHFVIKE